MRGQVDRNLKLERIRIFITGNVFSISLSVSIIKDPFSSGGFEFIKSRRHWLFLSFLLLVLCWSSCCCLVGWLVGWLVNLFFFFFFFLVCGLLVWCAWGTALGAAPGRPPELNHQNHPSGRRTRQAQANKTTTRRRTADDRMTTGWWEEFSDR